MRRAFKAYRLSSLILVAAIAVTSGLVINLLFVAGGLRDRVSITSGVDESKVIWIRLSSGLSEDPFSRSRQAEDLQALANIPDVQKTAAASSIPFARTGKYTFKVTDNSSTGDRPEFAASVYLWDHDAGAVLGATLAAGRMFSASEFVNYALFSPDPVPQTSLVTKSLADRLWPNAQPLGKQIRVNWMAESTTTVIGVVQDLKSPDPNGDTSDADAIIFPVDFIPNPVYLARTRSDGIADIDNRIATALYANDPRRIVESVESIADTRSSYFRGDMVMLWTFVVLAWLMIGLTIVGIVTVLNYWVASRSHEIGIRRALGARRSDILRQFVGEGAKLTMIGGLLGALAGIAINTAIMRFHEVDRIPISWLAIMIAAAAGIGTLSTIPPAVTASRKEPALASKL